MKRILLCFVLLVTFAVGTVSADKIKYRDQDFNFKSFNTIEVTNITYDKVEDENFIPDKTADSKIVTLLRSSFQDRKVAVRLPDEIKNPNAEPIGLKVVPQVSIRVYKLGYHQYYHDAWMENKEVIKDYKFTDSNGKEMTAQIPVNEVEAHPAGYGYVGRAELEFNVKDPRTGTVVYTVRDSRDRGGEQDTDGMLKRIIKDFANDITE